MKWRMVVHPDQHGVLARLGIRKPADLEGLDGEVVARERRSTVMRVDDPFGSRIVVYAKRYHYGTLRRRLRYALRKSRARREYESLDLLEQIHVPAAHAVAWAEARSAAGLLHAAWVLTVGITHAVPLERVLEEGGAIADTPNALRRRRAAIRRLGRLIGYMHEGSFVAGDLHFRNILVRNPAGRPEFFLIDSPRGAFRSTMWGLDRGWIHDLACLDKHAPRFFTRTDRLRFFIAWLGSRGPVRVHLPMMRKIQARAARLMVRRKRALARDALTP